MATFGEAWDEVAIIHYWEKQRKNEYHVDLQLQEYIQR